MFLLRGTRDEMHKSQAGVRLMQNLEAEEIAAWQWGRIRRHSGRPDSTQPPAFSS